MAYPRQTRPMQAWRFRPQSRFAHTAVRWFSGLACSLLLTLTGAAAQAQAPVVHQHAHVHGVAKLGVAVQDDAVTISLESPLDSVLGFEHRANTPAQQALVDAMRRRMNAPEGLFSFDAAAACSLKTSHAESAIFQPPPAGAPAEEHSDLDASFEYTCAHPEKLTKLDVGLFDAYPKLKKLDVDVATGRGQFKRDLASPLRTISLVR